MSHHTHRTSEQLNAMRRSYLMSTFERQDSISRWKRLESARSAMLALAIIGTLVGLVVAGALWYLYRNAVGLREFYIASIGLAISALSILVFGIIRAILTQKCEKAFIEYYENCIHVQSRSDSLKIETIDPVLENSIIISTATITADGITPPAPPKTKKKKKKKAPVLDFEPIVDDDNLDSAIVYIDGIEVGAVDLASPFSVFRVNPGLHTLKLRLKKYYARDDKALEIETPIATVHIDNNYRIFYYTINVQLKTHDRTWLSYNLKLAEYDDMTAFRRDVHKKDEIYDFSEDLHGRLYRRFIKLYRDPSIRETYVSTFTRAEEQRYLREKYNWLDAEETALDAPLLAAYRGRARSIQQHIMLTQSNHKLSENQKAKTLAHLHEQMDLLLVELFNRLPNSNGSEILPRQKTRLKNILLFGEDTIQYGDLASKLDAIKQDARIKDPNKTDIVVNIHNNT